jgi:hypothetical protein
MFVSRFLVSGSAVFVVLSFAVPGRAVSVLNEMFNSDTAFAKSNASGPSTFFCDTEDDNEYWGINDPSGNGDDYDGDPAPPSSNIPPYTGFSGKFLNAEDLNAQSELEALRLDWSDLNISGLSGLAFSGLFAARGDFQDGASPDGDYIKVQYRIDSNTSAFTNLLWFTPEVAATEPDRLREDPNFDGIGTGTALSVAAQSFSASISGTGSTLDLRILMVSDGDEELAFDSIMVTTPDGIPGDFNLNGIIDAADYVVWRKNAGTQADYNLWRSHFGQPAAAGAVATANAGVPEPATALILMFAAAGWWRRSRRNSQQLINS